MPGEFIFEFDDWPRAIFTGARGESTWHVALKLLAFLIYRARRPLVERGVGQRHKPDLVVLGADGGVRLWIDCGETSLRKLQRVIGANPRARIVVVKDTQRHLDAYSKLAGATLRDSARVLYLAFGDGLVQSVAGTLRQRNRVSFGMGPAGLRIGVNGRAYQGALLWRHGSAPT